MGRFVFVTWAGGGNAAATFPIVAELVARGHRVEMIGSLSQAPDVAATGAAFHPFVRFPPNRRRRSPETDAFRGQQGRMPDSALRRLSRWLAEVAAAAGEEVIDLLERSPADVVVADENIPDALMGAEKAGVRSASLLHTVWHYPTPGALPIGTGMRPGRGTLVRDRLASAAFAAGFEFSRPAVNGTRRQLGLPPVRRAIDQFIRADRLVVLSSKAFDFVPTRLPGNAVYVGAPSPRPQGRWLPPPGDGPLILVSLSTTFQNQRSLLARLAAELQPMAVRAVITTGPIDPVGLPSGGNLTVERHLPHADVLPHAALVITHAGHGTAMAAMSHGVPALCLPHGRDQPDIAARVVAAGAGLRLSKRSSSDALRQAICALLDEPRFTEAARLLSRRIAAEGGGTARAADELELLLPAHAH
jgi:MGT family glycosyltransferase